MPPKQNITYKRKLTAAQVAVQLARNDSESELHNDSDADFGSSDAEMEDSTDNEMMIHKAHQTQVTVLHSQPVLLS